MAKNEITIKVRIDDDGNLSAVGKKAKKAADGLDKTAKSAKTADRNMKGASQQSANSTKNFSKMAQGMTGTLVPAYATLAANIFAVTAAFNFFKNAADLRVLEESQANYAARTGTSLSLLTKRVQDATDGVLNFQSAASAVAIGRASGLGSDQLTELASLAKSASLALGRDLGDSFDRLIRGVTKAEPELLDELGIILRLEEATENYADALNLNAKDLTNYQRTQAVLNRVLEEGQQKFEDIGGEVNQFAKLGKSFRDLLKDIMDVISPIAEFIAESLSANVIALTGAFTLLGKGIVESLIPAGVELRNVFQLADDAQARLAKNVKSGPIADSVKSLEPLTNKQIAQLERSVKAGKSSILDFSKATREALSRDIAIIRAEHQVLIAENTSGIKRMFAIWRAQLYSFQAEYGRVMGTLKALTVGFAVFANKILGAAGIIGLLVTVGGLLKSVYDKFFRDQDIVNYNKSVQELTETFEKQNEVVFNLIRGFETASNKAESLVRNANLAANISTQGLEGFGLREVSVSGSSLQGTVSGSDLTDYGATARKVDTEARSANEKALGLMKETITSATTLLSLLPQSAEEGRQQLTASIFAISEAIEVYNKAIKEGSQKEVSVAIEAVNSAFSGLVGEIQDAKTTIKDPAGAIQTLRQLPEEFTILIRKMRQAPSEFDSFIQVIDKSSGALKTLQKHAKSMADLSEEEKIILRKLFPDIDLASKDISTVIKDLGDLKVKILKREFDAERAVRQVQIDREKGLRGLTQLQAEQAQRSFEIKALEAQRAQIETRITNLKAAKVKESDTIIRNLRQEQELLDAQIGSVQRLDRELAQLSDATSQAFESGLQKGLSSLIKGEETNFKNFIFNIAKATLEGAADSLAKIFTQKIMGIKSPAEKIKTAIVEGAEILANHIRSALGKPSTGIVKVDGAPGGTSTAGKTNVFGPFLTSLEDLFDKQSEGGFITKLGKVFLEGGKGIFSFVKGLLGLGSAGSGSSGFLTSAITTLFGGARYGGIMEGYATGGIARGSDAGYPAVLHGTEAVVPLPNNRSIPVDLKGSGQQNNVTVNVAVDNQGRATQDTQATSNQGANLGAAIAAAVQKELQNQKRSGGILNPYGAA